MKAENFHLIGKKIKSGKVESDLESFKAAKQTKTEN